MRTGRLVSHLSLTVFAGCMEQQFFGSPDRGTPVAVRPIVRIEPPQRDFGSPPVGCPLEQRFRVHNDGDGDLLVHAIGFVGASDELRFFDDNAVPFLIAPGKHVHVHVSYEGHDTADDYGQIVVGSDDPDRPEATADVRGAAVSAGPVREVFEQPPAVETDLLVVVDNSGSMEEEQASLAADFLPFVEVLVAAQADYRLAVLTTDDARFVGPVLTPSSADPVAEFQAQVGSVGIQGSPEEQPMLRVVEATSAGGDAAPGGAFLRDDAMTAVIVVTDEPDEFSPITVTDFVDHLLALEGGDPTRVRVHVVGADVPVPACASARAASVPLDQAVAATGGVFASVCSDWGVSLATVAAGSVVPLADVFPLSQAPIVATLSVTVDGTPATGWAYDAAAQAVVFDVAPPPGAVVEVTYEPAADCLP